MAEIPRWDERDQPTLQITDRTLSWNGYQDTMRLVNGPSTDTAEEFLDWVNDERIDLHSQLTHTARDSAAQFAARGAYPVALSMSVGYVLGKPPYPTYRMQPNSRVRGSYQAYRDANPDTMPVTPTFTFEEDEDIVSQFDPMLGIISVSDQLLRNESTSSITHAVADSLGQASMCNIVNIYLQTDPEPAFRWWYGYQWWHNGQDYGRAVHTAASEKIASQVRQDLRMSAEGDPDPSAWLEPYRRDNGYYYETGLAVALDIINSRLGFSQNAAGLYEPIWHFASRGGEEAARNELAAMVGRATSGQITLEDLEMIPIKKEGFPLEIMERVEEACAIDVSERPSRMLAERLQHKAGEPGEH